MHREKFPILISIVHRLHSLTLWVSWLLFVCLFVFDFPSRDSTVNLQKFKEIIFWKHTFRGSFFTSGVHLANFFPLSLNIEHISDTCKQRYTKLSFLFNPTLKHIIIHVDSLTPFYRPPNLLPHFCVSLDSCFVICGSFGT